MRPSPLLSGEAQDLKSRMAEQGTRIGELKAEIAERKKALGEGNKLTEAQAERIARLEEDLDFTEALRTDLVSQRNELHENVESLRKDNAALTGELQTCESSFGCCSKCYCWASRAGGGFTE